MADYDLKGDRLFGTDGIRGTPGLYPLTDGMIFKIGLSVARVISYRETKKAHPAVVIGRDTRLTGKRIESILADAINFHGINVFSAGVITTPGLSFLVKELSGDMGIMISASHNKPTDNGIKFFDSEGMKLSREEEDWIEEVILSNLIHRTNTLRATAIGSIYSVKKAQAKYVKFLLSTVPELKLEGMRLAVDCGWGAASQLISRIYKKLGADVISINDKPRGSRINIGGAIQPSYLRQIVLKEKADIGIALGKAFKDALGDKQGIKRYGCFTAVMDKVSIEAVVDISGRPSLFGRTLDKNDGGLRYIDDSVKFDDTDFNSRHAQEFLEAFVQHAGVSLVYIIM